jgi:putative ABC transport system permease protein
MNLAWKDIGVNFTRFCLTVVGVGSILLATLGINGLYRGIVHEVLLIINNIGADVWVVQGGTSGPFAEESRVPAILDRRVEGVNGVGEVRRFIQYNKQFVLGGRRVRFAITGLDFPRDTGSWVPLVVGRSLSAARFELIADESTGLVLGEQVRLGRDDYTVVGVTRGQVDSAGDGLVFVTIPDAQAIDSVAPSEAILLNRASPAFRADPSGRMVAAVIVGLRPYADIAELRRYIENWGDVNVLTREDQNDLMLNGRLWRLRLQILAFVGVMFAVAGTVVALTIYTIVLERAHSIALLKLMGARNRLIIGMILQHSLTIGACACLLAIILAHLIYPHFPRTVLLLPRDLMEFALGTLAVCVLASWFGIRRALRIKPQEVIT